MTHDSYPSFTAMIGGFEPSSEFGGPIEVAVSDGQVASVVRIGNSVPPSGALDLLDCFIMPFLVDLHAHVGPGLSKYGISRDEPEVVCLLSQGDAGPANLSRFVDSIPVGTYYALSLASEGEGAVGPCYDDPQFLDPEGFRIVYEQYSDLIWGVSVNLIEAARGTVDADVVYDESLQVAEELGLPVILGSGETTSTDVVAHLGGLRPGDILTYLFRPGQADLFRDADVSDAVREAQSRGVILDASHGASSFDFDVAQRALALGILPDTLSTDLSTFCASLADASLGTVVGKAIALGVRPEKAVAAVTRQPAIALGIENTLPFYKAGEPANFVVARWSEPKVLKDAVGRTREGRSLETVGVANMGAWSWVDRPW